MLVYRDSKVEDTRVQSLIRSFITVILASSMSLTSAEAASNLAQCVQVTSSGIIPSNFNPRYEVTLNTVCDTDLGSVTIQFYSGSNDIRYAVPQFKSIFRLSKWGETLYFDLGSIPKGIYVPRINITVSKEPWNPNNIYLNQFSIKGSPAPGPSPSPAKSSLPSPKPSPTPMNTFPSTESSVEAKIYPSNRNWAAWIDSYEYVSGPNPLVGNKATMIRISGGCTSSGKTVQVMKNRNDLGKKYSNGMRFIQPVLLCKAGSFSGTLKVTGETKIEITELPSSHSGTGILFRTNQEVRFSKVD